MPSTTTPDATKAMFMELISGMSAWADAQDTTSNN